MCSCFTNLFIAHAPTQEGCSCKDTEFGCCPDRRSPASGPHVGPGAVAAGREDGCGCAAGRHGCCYDGEEYAEGKDFEGCDSTPPTPTPDACGMDRDGGEGKNYTVRWFYDMEFGGCGK